MSVTAPIANIARGSFHDGPGVRTVVYFKGCGLRCRWCHNPETFTAAPQILFAPVRCIGCGRCSQTCPEHHPIKDGTVQFLRDGCTACGRCADCCPTGALTLCGEEKTVQVVFEELCRDQHYYKTSGGGVTLSGGECLLYPRFVSALLQKCRQAGISTAVETALQVPWENVQAAAPWVDAFFADLKLANGEKHRLYTGSGNAAILENLDRLSRLTEHLTVRIPVIPGVNDDSEELQAMAGILSGLGPGLQAVELLRYNPLAQPKYQMAGMAYEAFAGDAQTDEQMHRLTRQLQQMLPEHLPVRHH